MKQGGTWKRISLICTRKRGDLLLVKLGADDPSLLCGVEANRKAKKIAQSKGYKLFLTKDEIKVFGQNMLSERVYYFSKY